MNIYIGNLPYSTTEDSIRELFNEHGEVASVRIITDNVTGESKGFGFVDMANDAEAQSAIDALHGKEIDGRTIVVSKGRQREERGDRGGYRGGTGGGGGGGGGGRSFQKRSRF